jgi:hypothetical protein
MPAKYTTQERDEMVYGLCDLLGLTSIQDSIVGTVEKRGISGAPD